MTHHLPNPQKEFHWTDRKYHWIILVCSVVLIAFFAYIDYLDGPEIHISVLYMIPVFFTTWVVGFRAGAALSLLSGLTLLIDPIFYPHGYSSLYPVIFNIASLFTVNTVFSVSLALLKKKFFEQEDLLRHDGLTGLLNIDAFFKLAEQERVRAIRYNHPMTVCFLDLDNFKQVNDTKGHLEGTELLKMMADVLKLTVRETDYVARLGGDEFMILLPVTGSAAAKTLIRKIQKNLRTAFRKRASSTTPSIGMATFKQIPAAVNVLVSMADELMYDAKKKGKNRIVAKVFGN